MKINDDSLHTNAVLLIIYNIFACTDCIPKDITMGTSEVISNDGYSINEITLTAKENYIKLDAQTNCTQKSCTVKIHIKGNISGQPSSQIS